MANDVLGINPKYEKLINMKLNDADSYNTFMELVESAKSDILRVNERIKNEGIKPDVMRCGCVFTPGNTDTGYDLYKMNRDANMEYDGTICSSPKTCKWLKDMANGISAPRLTKYVNAGLMGRGKGASKQYYYYFPWDFFTTNDLSIKLSPNSEYEWTEFNKFYNF